MTFDAAGLIATGCSRDGQSDQPTDECTVILSAAFDRAKPAIKAEARKHPDTAKFLSNRKRVMGTRCREDPWSQAALACIKASTDQDSYQECQRNHLTEEQINKLLHAVSTVDHAIEDTAADILRSHQERNIQS